MVRYTYIRQHSGRQAECNYPCGEVLPRVLPVGEYTTRSTMCRQHREAILGKVPVKGEGSGNTKPLHHRKACRIGERKVFVRILVDNRPRTLYITRCDPYQGCRALLHVP